MYHLLILPPLQIAKVGLNGESEIDEKKIKQRSYSPRGLGMESTVNNAHRQSRVIR